jgi:hypothetical protein
VVASVDFQNTDKNPVPKREWVTATTTTNRCDLPDPFPPCWSYQLPTRVTRRSVVMVMDDKGRLMISGQQLLQKLLSCGYTATQAETCYRRLLQVCGNNATNSYGDISSHFHPLLDKEWQQQCLDPHGNVEKIVGTIDDYQWVRKKTGQGKLDSVFSIRLQRDRNVAPGGLRLEQNMTIVTEHDAMAGVAAAQRNRQDQPNRTALVNGWVCPDTFLKNVIGGADGVSPTIALTHGGFDAVLWRDRSKIPNAGDGLFIKVKPSAAGKKGRAKCLQLEPGQFIDLGVYGPHSAEDLIDTKQHQAKCFLLGNTPKIYVFDLPARPGYLIDPVDAATGELRDATKQSLLVYANEPNGTECPSLHVKYDAYGRVHYLLGHPDQQIFIPDDTAVELKVTTNWVRRVRFSIHIFVFPHCDEQVDYTETYEITRILCGYARVSGNELEKLQREIALEESNFLTDLESHFTMDDMMKALQLVEQRKDHTPPVRSSAAYFQRALLLTIVIRKRLEEEIPSLEQPRAMDRAQACLVWLCNTAASLKLDLKTDIVMKFGLLAAKLGGDVSLTDKTAGELCKMITGKHNFGRKRARRAFKNNNRKRKRNA